MPHPVPDIRMAAVPAPEIPAAVSFRGVGYWRAQPKHARPRRARNEALNRVREFAALFRSLPGFADGAASAPDVVALLHDVSVDIPRGAVVCVVDVGGQSRHAFLRLAARLEAPRAGTVRYRGSMLGLDRLVTMPFAFESVRSNIELHAETLGLPGRSIAEAMSAIRAFPGIGELLDLPSHRVPKAALADILLSAVCNLPADIVVVGDLRRPSDDVRQMWEAFLEQVPTRGTTVLLSARNLAAVLPWASHLVLLENCRLRAFGPARDIAATHAEFLEAALQTPIGRDWPGRGETEDVAEEEEAEAEVEAEEEGGEEESREPDDDDTGMPEEQARPRSDATAQGVVKAALLWIGHAGLDDRQAAAPPSRLDRGAEPEWRRHLPVFFIERALDIEFAVDVLDAPACIRPCLDLRWKDSVLAARAPGPAFTALSPGRFLLGVTIPPGYLARALWSIDLVLRDDPDEGSGVGAVAVTYGLFAAPEGAYERPAVPNKWSGMLSPLLAEPRIEAQPLTDAQSSAAIRFADDRGAALRVVPPLAPVDVHVQWPILEEARPASISVELLRGRHILTQTPDCVVRLTPGTLLCVTARIGEGLLTPGRYSIRLRSRGPGPMRRSDPPVPVVEASLRVSPVQDAHAPGFCDGPLHADFDWRVVAVDAAPSGGAAVVQA